MHKATLMFAALASLAAPAMAQDASIPEPVEVMSVEQVQRTPLGELQAAYLAMARELLQTRARVKALEAELAAHRATADDAQPGRVQVVATVVEVEANDTAELEAELEEMRESDEYKQAKRAQDEADRALKVTEDKGPKQLRTNPSGYESHELSLARRRAAEAKRAVGMLELAQTRLEQQIERLGADRVLICQTPAGERFRVRCRGAWGARAKHVEAGNTYTLTVDELPQAGQVVDFRSAVLVGTAASG